MGHSWISTSNLHVVLLILGIASGVQAAAPSRKFRLLKNLRPACVGVDYCPEIDDYIKGLIVNPEDTEGQARAEKKGAADSALITAGVVAQLKADGIDAVVMSAELHQQNPVIKFGILGQRSNIFVSEWVRLERDPQLRIRTATYSFDLVSQEKDPMQRLHLLIKQFLVDYHKANPNIIPKRSSPADDE